MYILFFALHTTSVDEITLQELIVCHAVDDAAATTSLVAFKNRLQ